MKASSEGGRLGGTQRCLALPKGMACCSLPPLRSARDLFHCHWDTCNGSSKGQCRRFCLARLHQQQRNSLPQHTQHASPGQAVWQQPTGQLDAHASTASEAQRLGRSGAWWPVRCLGASLAAADYQCGAGQRVDVIPTIGQAPHVSLLRCLFSGMTFGFPYCFTTGKGGPDDSPYDRKPGIGKSIPDPVLNQGQKVLNCGCRFPSACEDGCSVGKALARSPNGTEGMQLHAPRKIALVTDSRKCAVQPAATTYPS
jgi:hypothetical protein